MTEQFNKFRDFFFKRGVIYAFTVVAVFAPAINYAQRMCYVFADDLLFKGFSYILLGLMIANALLMLSLSFGVFKGRDIRTIALKRLYIAGACLSVFLFLLNSVFVIMSFEDTVVYLMYFLRELPYLIALFAGAFIILVYPEIKKEKRKIISVILTASLVAGIFFSAFEVKFFSFSSEPVVFDSGAGYNIVFSCNANSTGFVEYSYGGKEYKVYDNINGKINVGRIHTVFVPYAHLDNNSYTVSGQKVIDELGYGGAMGRTLKSSVYNFRNNTGLGCNIIALNDWHIEDGRMLKAASNLDKPDMVIIGGDFCNALNDIKDIIKHLLMPISSVTKGSVPVIFCRGNHETRGEEAKALSRYLGYDNFYYQISKGDVNFIILDSAEDKADSHPEYGGLADFQNLRIRETEWLKGLPPSPKAYNIAICHDPAFHIDDNAAEWEEELLRLNVNLMLSGHSHDSKIVRDKSSILTVLCGGRTEKEISGREKKVFIASQINIYGNTVHIRSVDQLGNIYLDEDLVLA